MGMLELRPRPIPGLSTLWATTLPSCTRPQSAARTMRVPPSPALMESFPTVWSLLWPLPPLLRLMLKLIPRLTPGCTITGLAMLPVPMVMVTMAWVMVIIWDILVTTVIILVTLDIMDITWATTARGPPRLNPGCTTPMLDTDSTHTDMATMAMVWATLPMLDITPTLTSEAAETTTEPWFPAPGNSVEVSALVLLK